MNKSNFARVELSDYLIKLLMNNTFDGIGIVIKGDWGAGKSYFWRNSIAYSQIRNFVTVSLFRMGSIEDIERDIILQFSNLNFTIDLLKKYAKKLAFAVPKKLGGDIISSVPISSILTLMEKKDFKSITVCFDDFERRPETISLKRVLGFISYLKEEKNCNVVLILNEKYLEGLEKGNSDENDEVKPKNRDERKSADSQNIKDADLWKEFKEKVIDYELEFRPSSKENIDAILKKFELHKPVNKLVPSVLYKIVDNLKCNNMRMMRRAFFSIMGLKWLESIDIEDDFKQEIYHQIFRSSLCYYMNKDNVFEGFLGIGLFNPTILELIKNYVKYGYIDQNEFREIVVERINEIKRQPKPLEEILDKYLQNLENDKDQFLEELKKLMETPNIAPAYFGNIYHLLKQIDDANNLSQYLKLFEDNLRKFIEEKFKNHQHAMLLIESLNRNLSEDKDLAQIVDKVIKDEKRKYLEKIKSSKENLSALIKKIISEQSWNRLDEEILKSISADDWQELLTKKLLNLKDIKTIYETMSASQEKINEMIIDLSKNEYLKFKIRLNGFNMPTH